MVKGQVEWMVAALCDAYLKWESGRPEILERQLQLLQVVVHGDLDGDERLRRHGIRVVGCCCGHGEWVSQLMKSAGER